MLHRTIIVPASDYKLADALCSGLSPEGGRGMFKRGVVEKSAPDHGPATWLISAGPISSDMAALLPCKFFTIDAEGQQTITTTPGHPELVPALAAKAGITVTRAEIDALYAAIDVSDQDPFAALDRLDLQIARVPLP